MRVVIELDGWQIRCEGHGHDQDYVWASHMECVNKNDSDMMVYSWFMDEDPAVCCSCRGSAVVPDEVQALVRLHNAGHNAS